MNQRGGYPGHREECVWARVMAGGLARLEVRGDGTRLGWIWGTRRRTLALRRKRLAGSEMLRNRDREGCGWQVGML